MTVSYLSSHSVSKNSTTFLINGAEVTIFRQNGSKSLQLNAGSAPLLEEMLDTLSKQLKADAPIFDFFQVGYITGLRLINACLHDEFVAYFQRRRSKYPYPNGKRRFDCFLNQIVGAKSGTSYIHQFKKFPFLQELYDIFESVSISLDTFRDSPEYKKISDSPSIEFKGYSENRLHIVYIVNGQEVFLSCKNKVAPVSTRELHQDCIHVKEALLTHQDIKPFIKKYGGKFTYEILNIIGPDELLDYFKNIVASSIKKRLPIYPQKIIKEYGFSPILKTDEPFVLLDYLERLSEESLIEYIETNDLEILHDDIWLLYYMEQGKIHWGRFDFTQFNGPIRKELVAFMRACYHLSSCSHLLRIYYCLCRAITDLDSPKSILSTELSDALSFRAALTADTSLSVATISEHLYYVAIFFDYTSLSQNYTGKNPFRTVSVKSNALSLNPTSPISPDELKSLLERLSLMPTYIQIAILILCETGARANEVCGVTIDEFHYECGSTPILDIILRKNRRARANRGAPTFVRHKISDYLAKRIAEYITEHEKERNAIGTKQILVYTPSTRRTGSCRPPVVLSSSSLSYWLKKLSGSDFECTARIIRAGIGRAAFAEGKSASEVAAKLGNSPQIAESHYNFLSPRSEAELYDRFYDRAFSFYSDSHGISSLPQESKELYGICTSSSHSNCNQNRCETCPQRITCKST